MEPIENAVHLCVDMQMIFAKGGIWETPWMERVLPNIQAIVARYPERTIFTRFIPPVSPEEAQGRWRRYFRRWKVATRGDLGGTQLDIVPELARFAPPATVVEKPTYSAFHQSQLSDLLCRKKIGTVVLSGAETDVCVLSTAMDAVDLGLRVVVVEDAVCSSSDAGHDALMTMYRMRYKEQIDLIKTEALPEVWQAAKAGWNDFSRSGVRGATQRSAPMSDKDLNELFLDTLKDIYYAEKQILKALPKMAKAASSDEVQAAFEKHHEETETHLERLERVFEMLGKPARGKKCEAIEGIIEEGKEIMDDYADTPALDAGLLAAAQAVEHYEISRYGTLKAWAEKLNLTDAIELLDQTLAEEKKTDEILTKIAQTAVNYEAAA